MSDTPPEIAAQFDALMAQRSGSDRVRMACEMFDLARTLAVAGIRADEPAISNSGLRARLFERLYGDDFSEEEGARIVATLSRRPFNSSARAASGLPSSSGE